MLPQLEATGGMKGLDLRQQPTQFFVVGYAEK